MLNGRKLNVKENVINWLLAKARPTGASIGKPRDAISKSQTVIQSQIPTFGQEILTVPVTTNVEVEVSSKKVEKHGFCQTSKS